MNAQMKEALSKYDKNELIFASQLYRNKLAGKISEAAFYKMLERLCENGEIVKISKGIYYYPKKGKYGMVPPSEKEIVDVFTKNNTGIVVGYSLYNELNLTTQIPKQIIVYSANTEGQVKNIGNVCIIQMRTNYSNNIKKRIRALEVLQNYNRIQDINYNAFITYSKTIANEYDEKIYDSIIDTFKYKKSTIAFLREILNYYHIPNTLNKYLSSLSEYKYPKMEEIYEIAQL